MGVNGWMSRKTANWSQSWYMSNTAVQYVCAACGATSGVFFIVAFIVANFIPPTHPWWTAEQTAHFYQDNKTRIRAGASILMIAGGFYLPFSTAISYQIRRIPRIPWIIYQMQLASAAAGIWTFMLPGIVLAIASYRPERPVEITHALNDFFWLVALMPWPTFMVQNFAFAFAIIYDNRKIPLFPKELAIFNMIMPIIFATATGIHTQLRGPFAYNGVIAFYIVGFTFVVQLIVDGIFLALAARNEQRAEQEGKLEDYENNVGGNLGLSNSA
ncbi:integral membrane protein [Grosmannia clavigera kw1407]|uniref:Integral membrane protein n=1 Tax=Grosmannia clavigera (strain kw1407 / UAMH 11150) TaxID=655863 RepID=F0XIP2_GROCL|nr:uncharacterized protein CMQ_8029 [Grosmannia clavigera kw1407]EFX02449.1 integral membrane protein [Grosmannia clavigera kw1407]